MRARIAFALLFSFSSILGCSSAPDSDGGTAASESEAASVHYGLPVGVPVTRAYFHRYSSVETTPAQPDEYLLFDLVANARVRVELKAPQRKTGPAGSVYGELSRVTMGGRLAHVGWIDGTSGDGSIDFTSRHGGSYVVDVWQQGYGWAVEVDLSCLRKDGKCSLKAQPDDTCAAANACDDGLVCLPPVGKGTSCPAPGTAGHCGFLADVGCGAGPVCGCDGRDYADACAAAQSGASVKQRFSCACDPTIWSLATSAALAGGTYEASWVTGPTHKDVSITFSANDGTYTESLTTGPYCVKGQPCPAFPTQTFQAQGTYAVAGGNVTLTPDAASSPNPPSVFTLESNCTGALVLRSQVDGLTQDYDVADDD